MAEWVQRPRADGTIIVQIRWRQDGRYHSESFTNVRLAVEFRTAVEEAANRWPTGWIRGAGWAPAPPTPRVLTFADVATGDTGLFPHQQRRVKRGKLTPYTVYRDRRTYELHFEETFGHRAFTQIDEHDITEWVDTLLRAHLVDDIRLALDVDLARPALGRAQRAAGRERHVRRRGPPTPGHAVDFEGHGIGKALVPLVVRREARKEMPANLATLERRLETTEH